MGLFNRNKVGKGIQPVDPSLPDPQWIAACEANYSGSVEPYYGSPETMARGYWDYLGVDDPGTALFFCRKSIDMLHSHYLALDPPRRTPGPADEPIVIGFLATLKQVNEAHPNADVGETVREVTHRLRTISRMCQGMGVSPGLYQMALDEMTKLTPEVDVSDVLW